MRITEYPAALPGATTGEAARFFLFVTAPFGPFSRLLGKALRSQGARCERILLNGGDLADWGPGHAQAYKGAADVWPSWIADWMARNKVTDLICHGDSNPYGQAAMTAAHEAGLRVHVLEQGYVRPHWITLDRNGVNARSGIAPETGVEGASSVEPPFVALGRTAPRAVLNITRYHLAACALAPLFPRHRSPYAYAPALQCLGHILRYARQKLLAPLDGRRTASFLGEEGPLFLALLQRPGDSQLTRHSSFGEGSDIFINSVIGSFAAHAPDNARLILKSHPLDHGLENHARNVRRAARALGVIHRVRFVDAGDLNEMLRRASAVVSVNSSGGMAALEAGVPTMVLGRALYDLPGLTHRKGLDSIWRDPQAPDPRLFGMFRSGLIRKTQVNGAFATRQGIDLAVRGVAARLLHASERPSAYRETNTAAADYPQMAFSRA